MREKFFFIFLMVKFQSMITMIINYGSYKSRAIFLLGLRSSQEGELSAALSFRSQNTKFKIRQGEYLNKMLPYLIPIITLPEEFSNCQRMMEYPDFSCACLA